MSAERIAGDLLTACWLAFFLYWISWYGRNKTTVEREDWASQLSHRGPMIAAYTLLTFHWSRFALDRRVLPAAPALAAAGVGLAVLGLAIGIWARRTLGGNWSSSVTLKEGHTLTQTGPYRWVRNPIYTGLLTMFVGTTLVIGRVNAFVALGLALIAFFAKLKREEGYMLRQFPDEYPEYRRRVAALVPFVF